MKLTSSSMAKQRSTLGCASDAMSAASSCAALAASNELQVSTL